MSNKEDIENDLRHYYDTQFYIPNSKMPPYEDIDNDFKNGLAKSLGFAAFRASKALNLFCDTYAEIMLSVFSRN